MDDKVQYRVYKVIEYIVEVDPAVVDFEPKCKKCKSAGEPASIDDIMGAYARLIVGRGDYQRKSEIKVRTFKQGEPPETITINEDL